MRQRIDSRTVTLLALLLLATTIAWTGADRTRRLLQPDAAIHNEGPRILLLYDMEGASGITDPRACTPDAPELYAKGRESLTSDVNAVVAGLFEGGAASLDIANTHGYGDDSLVPRERLDSRAKILSLTTPVRIDPYSPAPRNRFAERGTYDAIVTVAMHAKPLSGGFIPHTLTSGTTPLVNGQGLTETDLLGFAYGAAAIPVIFASGDDHLKADLAVTMPWLEYVVVKRATGPASADPLPPETVRVELRAAAARAIRSLQIPGRMKAMQPSFPLTAGLVGTFPAFLPPGLHTLPGIGGTGDTVTFTATGYGNAYQGIRALQILASRNYTQTMVLNLLRSKPELRVTLRQALDSVLELSNAYETGKWKPRFPGDIGAPLGR